jgi:hypothetical protein
MWGRLRTLFRWLNGVNESTLRYTADELADAYARGRDLTWREAALTMVDRSQLRQAYHQGRAHQQAWLDLHLEIKYPGILYQMAQDDRYRYKERARESDSTDRVVH